MTHLFPHGSTIAILLSLSSHTRVTPAAALRLNTTGCPKTEVSVSGSLQARQASYTSPPIVPIFWTRPKCTASPRTEEEPDNLVEVSALLDIDTVEPSRTVRARCGWRAFRPNLTAALGSWDRHNSSVVAETACSAVFGHHVFNV